LIRVSKKKIFFRYIIPVVLPFLITAILVVVSVININRSVREKNKTIYTNLAYELEMKFQNILDEAEAILLSFSADKVSFINLKEVFNSEGVSFENLNVLYNYQNSMDIIARTRFFIESFYYIPVTDNPDNPMMISGNSIKAVDKYLDETFLEMMDKLECSSNFFLRNKNLTSEAGSSQETVITRYEEAKDFGGNRLGFLIVNLDTRIIEKEINSVFSGREGLLYAVFSDNGDCISACDQIKMDPSLMASLRKASSGGNFKDGKKTYYSVSLNRIGNSFHLVLVASAEALLNSNESLIFPSILITFLSLLIGAIVVIMILRKKQDDVALFSDYLNSIDQNGALTPVPNPGINLEKMDASVVKEFMLYDYINLHISQRELKERKLELEMLRKQLSPHFLLNCLQMLNWKVMNEMKGYSELNSIIENLTVVLSYSLYPGNVLASVDDEIQYSKAYASLMNRNQPIQVVLYWDIDNELKKMRIPRQVLQPLLENAFKYAFSDRIQHPEIRISGIIFQGNMKILISDNGIGIPETVLSEIIKTMNEESSGIGIGIQNTDRRIKLLFGHKFGIIIKSKIDCGTTVELFLPRIITS